MSESSRNYSNRRHLLFDQPPIRPYNQPQATQNNHPQIMYSNHPQIAHDNQSLMAHYNQPPMAHANQLPMANANQLPMAHNHQPPRAHNIQPLRAHISFSTAVLDFSRPRNIGNPPPRQSMINTRRQARMRIAPYIMNLADCPIPAANNNGGFMRNADLLNTVFYGGLPTNTRTRQTLNRASTTWPLYPLQPSRSNYRRFHKSVNSIQRQEISCLPRQCNEQMQPDARPLLNGIQTSSRSEHYRLLDAPNGNMVRLSRPPMSTPQPSDFNPRIQRQEISCLPQRPWSQMQPDARPLLNGIQTSSRSEHYRLLDAPNENMVRLSRPPMSTPQPSDFNPRIQRQEISCLPQRPWSQMQPDARPLLNGIQTSSRSEHYRLLDAPNENMVRLSRPPMSTPQPSDFNPRIQRQEISCLPQRPWNQMQPDARPLLNGIQTSSRSEHYRLLDAPNENMVRLSRPPMSTPQPSDFNPRIQRQEISCLPQRPWSQMQPDARPLLNGIQTSSRSEHYRLLDAPNENMVRLSRPPMSTPQPSDFNPRIQRQEISCLPQRPWSQMQPDARPLLNGIQTSSRSEHYRLLDAPNENMVRLSRPPMSTPQPSDFNPRIQRQEISCLPQRPWNQMQPDARPLLNGIQTSSRSEHDRLFNAPNEKKARLSRPPMSTPQPSDFNPRIQRQEISCLPQLPSRQCQPDARPLDNGIQTSSRSERYRLFDAPNGNMVRLSRPRMSTPQPSDFNPRIQRQEISCLPQLPSRQCQPDARPLDNEVQTSSSSEDYKLIDAPNGNMVCSSRPPMSTPQPSDFNPQIQHQEISCLPQLPSGQSQPDARPLDNEVKTSSRSERYKLIDDLNRNIILLSRPPLSTPQPDKRIPRIEMEPQPSTSSGRVSVITRHQSPNVTPSVVANGSGNAVQNTLSVNNSPIQSTVQDILQQQQTHLNKHLRETMEFQSNQILQQRLPFQDLNLRHEFTMNEAAELRRQLILQREEQSQYQILLNEGKELYEKLLREQEEKKKK